MLVSIFMFNQWTLLFKNREYIILIIAFPVLLLVYIFDRLLISHGLDFILSRPKKDSTDIYSQCLELCIHIWSCSWNRWRLTFCRSDPALFAPLLCLQGRPQLRRKVLICFQFIESRLNRSFTLYTFVLIFLQLPRRYIPYVRVSQLGFAERAGTRTTIREENCLLFCAQSFNC